MLSGRDHSFPDVVSMPQQGFISYESLQDAQTLDKLVNLNKSLNAVDSCGSACNTMGCQGYARGGGPQEKALNPTREVLCSSVGISRID